MLYRKRLLFSFMGILALAIFGAGCSAGEGAGATQIEVVPEIGFSSGIQAASSIPADWSQSKALYFLGSPMVTGFKPNSAGVADGDSFTRPFFDSTITFTVTRNASVVEFAGTVANGYGRIDITYDIANRTFEFEERILVIDPVGSGSTSRLGAIEDQPLAIIKRTQEPIELSESLNFLGVIDATVLFGPDCSTVQISPIEIYRNKDGSTELSGWASYSAYFGTPDPTIDSNLTGSAFGPDNLEAIHTYMDGLSPAPGDYSPSAQVTIYDGTTFTEYRNDPQTGEEAIPGANDSAAVTFEELKAFLATYPDWSTGLTEIK